MLLNPAQARRVLAYAARERFALLAVNADSPSAVQDVLEAARACEAPVIIETSLWQLTSRCFGAGDPVRGMARYLVQLALAAADPAFAHLPVIYHTDHIKGPRTLEILGAAICGVARFGPPDGPADALRASSISLDSSALSEQENIALCAQLCAIARDRGLDLTLEMESGVDDGLTPPEVATPPRSAASSRCTLGAWRCGPRAWARATASPRRASRPSPPRRSAATATWRARCAGAPSASRSMARAAWRPRSSPRRWRRG